jgi:hypothetical protein
MLLSGARERQTTTTFRDPTPVWHAAHDPTSGLGGPHCPCAPADHIDRRPPGTLTGPTAQSRRSVKSADTSGARDTTGEEERPFVEEYLLRSQSKGHTLAARSEGVARWSLPSSSTHASPGEIGGPLWLERNPRPGGTFDGGGTRVQGDDGVGGCV